MTQNNGAAAEGLRSIKAIVADLSRRLPDELLKSRFAKDKKTGHRTEIKYLPWHTATRILDKYAPGWKMARPQIFFDATSKRLFLVIGITIPCLEGEVTRYATGTETLNVDSYGDPSSNAESMALRRCAAKFGLGRHLYGSSNGARPGSRADAPPPTKAPAEDAKQPNGFHMPNCNCGQPRIERAGVSKKSGRPYGGYFCAQQKCDPVWLN